MSGDSDNKSEKKELTRIEDLSEFLHEENPDLDSKLDFGGGKPKRPKGDESEDSTEETSDNPFASSDGDVTEEAPAIDLSTLDSSENSSEDSSDSTETQSNITATDDLVETNNDSVSLNEETTSNFESTESETEAEQISSDQDLNVTSIQEDSSSMDLNTLETTETKEIQFQTESEAISGDNSLSDNAHLDEAISVHGQGPLEVDSALDQTASNDLEPMQDHRPPPPSPSREKESFSDVREFADAMSFGQVAQGGNPPYGIILDNIQFQEDADQIRSILKDHGLYNDQNSKDIDQGLGNGRLLLSQLPEYSAIYLAHALRRFNLTIEMGLSVELHASKHYHEDFKGLVSKHSLLQNVDQTLDFRPGPLTLEQIIITTLPQVEHYRIHRYLDVVTESILIDEGTFLNKRDHHLLHPNMLRKNLRKDANDSFLDKTKEDIFLEFASSNLAMIYDELAVKLKQRTLSAHGNAIVGITYQIIPINVPQYINSPESDMETMKTHYKITCTGNVVWISGLADQ